MVSLTNQFNSVVVAIEGSPETIKNARKEIDEHEEHMKLCPGNCKNNLVFPQNK